MSSNIVYSRKNKTCARGSAVSYQTWTTVILQVALEMRFLVFYQRAEASDPWNRCYELKFRLHKL